MLPNLTLIPPAVSILELRIKVTRNVMCHDLSILRTPSRTQIIQRSTSSHFPRTRIRLPDSYIPPFLEKNVPVLFTIENTTTLFTNKLQKKEKRSGGLRPSDVVQMTPSVATYFLPRKDFALTRVWPLPKWCSNTTHIRLPYVSMFILTHDLIALSSIII